MCDNCYNLNITMNSDDLDDSIESISIEGSLIYYINNVKSYIKKCCLLKYYTGKNILEPKFEERLLDNIKCSNNKRQKYIKVNNENEIIPVYEFNFTDKEIINHPNDCTNKYKMQINRDMYISENNEQYKFTTKIQYNKFIKDLEKNQVNMMVDETFGYVYLLKDRAAVRSNEEVYKIGRTNQPNLNRFKSYPKGFDLLTLKKCSDCSLVEKKIMQLFKQKYIHRRDYGNEYFEGNPDEMEIDILNIIYNRL